MSENYYIILKLPIERFVSGKEALDALEKQLRTWNASVSTNERNKAEKYSTPIREAISDEARWRQEYENAKSKIEKNINSWITVVGGKGYITPTEIAGKAKSLNVSEKFITNIVNGKHIRIENGGKEKKKVVTLEDMKPKSVLKFSQPSKSLEQLSCATAYSFLEKYQRTIARPTNYAFSEDTDAARCVRTADQIRDAWKAKKEDAEKSAVETVCTLISHFADPNHEQNQAEYNKYVVYIKLKSILDELKNNFKDAEDKTLYNMAKKEYIERIIAIVQNRETAESILSDFCQKNGITIMQQAKSLGLCPFCGNTFPKPDGKTPSVCPVCNKSFMLKCPDCNKSSNFAETRVCGCGFNLDQYGKLAKKCRQAREYIAQFNFDFADTRISEIKKIWRGFPLLADVEEEYRTKKSETQKYIDNLRKYIRERNFQAARLEYDRMKRNIAGYSDLTIEAQINREIRKADEFFANASKATDQRTKLMNLIKATETVADHAEALKALSMMVPEPVTSLSCTVPNNAEYVNLKWTSNNPADTASYVILRKEYSRPINSTDGNIATVSEKAFCDKSLRTGVPYFYSVYSTRGNSKTALCTSGEPVIIFPILRELTTVPTETNISVSWKTNKGDMNIEVFRCTVPTIKRYGEGTKINLSGNGGFVDRSVSVGEKYYYNIFFTVTVGSKKIISQPTTVEASPIKLGKKLDFRLEQTDDRIYINLRTTPDAGSQVCFFTSKNQIIIPDDGITSMKNVTETLRLSPLSTIRESNTKYYFTPEKNKSGYIYILTVSGDTAVIGHEEYFENLEKIDVKSVRSDGTKIHIELAKWPETANTMTIVFSTEKHVSAPNEAGSSKFSVNKLEYRSTGITMNFEKDTRYYISGFIRGGNGYTPVFRTTFGNEKKTVIKYRFEKKKIIGRRKIIITLETKGSLPILLVQCKTNYPPFNQHDGYTLTELSSTDVKQEFEFDVPAPKNQARGTKTLFRLFVKDEVLGEKYELSLKDGCEPFIT